MSEYSIENPRIILIDKESLNVPYLRNVNSNKTVQSDKTVKQLVSSILRLEIYNDIYYSLIFDKQDDNPLIEIVFEIFRRHNVKWIDLS